MEPVIRRAACEDFDEVYPLFEQLWPGKAINRDALCHNFSQGVDSEHDVLLCAVLNGKIVGFCAYAVVNNLWQEGQIAYIYAMVVDEAFRSRGIGALLIGEVVAGAKERGLKRVELDSGFPRERAHAFYEKLGFEKRAYLFSTIL
jgi:ribosomal protein S18 acetylase RimI-like enzyme